MDFVVFFSNNQKAEKGDTFSHFLKLSGPSIENVRCLQTLHLYDIKFITFPTQEITFPVENIC